MNTTTLDHDQNEVYKVIKQKKEPTSVDDIHQITRIDKSTIQRCVEDLRTGALIEKKWNTKDGARYYIK